MNTKFSYLYRDGDNYKCYGAVVLAGEFTGAHYSRLVEALSDGECFIASQVGVPEVFLWDPEADYDPADPKTWPREILLAGEYAINESDHSWHEFTGFEITADEPTDPRSLEQFVQAFATAARQGWREFEPESRKPDKVGGPR